MIPRTASPITAERLRQLLNYDPWTGIFRWRMARGPAAAESIAGSVDRNSYRRMILDRKHYLAHRLAWLYVCGSWPEGDLDHINRNRDDNRISNLRPATNSQNQGNVARWSTNTSGFRGVTRKKHRPNGRPWRANLQVKGGNIYLGSFNTPEEASEAYLAAARLHFGEFIR